MATRKRGKGRGKEGEEKEKERKRKGIKQRSTEGLKSRPLVPPSPHRLHYARLESLAFKRIVSAGRARIEEFESLQEAIAMCNYPRVYAVVRAAKNRGLGPGATRDLLAKAVIGVYRPRQFTAPEYELMHAVWSMSGFGLATVLHKTCGFPSYLSVRDHVPRYQLRAATAYADITQSAVANVRSIFAAGHRAGPATVAPHGRAVFATCSRTRLRCGTSCGTTTKPTASLASIAWRM